ncbi:hypothetical protein B0H11DRAFT_1903911 [Mycena galericulata]|nr:hypothetical protein B0H11DRAFT_1903911 [Mycena galericulata]
MPHLLFRDDIQRIVYEERKLRQARLVLRMPFDIASATGAGLPSLVPEAFDSVDKFLGIDERHNDNSPVSVLTTVLRTLRKMDEKVPVKPWKLPKEGFPDVHSHHTLVIKIDGWRNSGWMLLLGTVKVLSSGGSNAQSLVPSENEDRGSDEGRV